MVKNFPYRETLKNMQKVCKNFLCNTAYKNKKLEGIHMPLAGFNKIFWLINTKHRYGY